MKTGVSYMGHHNPRHLKTDFQEMEDIGLDDVFVCMQENDFAHFTGKIDFPPKIARDHGVRPLALFWGALNLFGGGRSSQFLLEHPEGFQVGREGRHIPRGCYVNPVCVKRIQEMIDIVAGAGYGGYFVDEPTSLKDCFCPSCRAKFGEWFGGDLASADEEKQREFRQRCVVTYVATISDYCKANHPQLETSCCVMPHDHAMWEATAAIKSLDNLGTDIYWVNRDRDVEEMRPIIRQLHEVCQRHGKIHHEWLQGWNAKRGNEHRILAQGKVLLQEKHDALYVWAWHGQVGTTESCDDPELSWSHALEVLRKAKMGSYAEEPTR